MAKAFSGFMQRMRFTFAPNWAYCFLLIGLMQCILFVPLYITRYAEGNFFPTLGSFLYRNNPDIFRWSLDYALLLIAVLAWCKIKQINWLIRAASILYLILFLFQLYYFISWKIYGEVPLWTYDLALIIRVLPVFMKTMRISPYVFGLVFGLILFIFYLILCWVHRSLVQSLSYLPGHILWITALLVFVFPFLMQYAVKDKSSAASKYPVIHWILEDMRWTFTQDRINPLPDLNKKISYTDYYQLPIKSKPSIYLIFVEAYGSIAGAVSPYQQDYWDRLRLMESRLTTQGWQSASTLSNSTILGGRSWLGFTTLMSGLRIDNHPAYEKLIQSYTNYPQLIRVLNRFGYDTYRLNTMANFGDSFEKLDSVAVQFYDNKTWTKFSDIPYQGYRYNYFGGIPDQFALNHWDENVLNKSKKPYFLFFITLNTHAPFYLPPPLAENWKDLNAIKSTPHRRTRAEAGSPVYRYEQAVLYNLAFLEKYILEKADSNSLFILVGDHQPAGMEYMLQSKTDLYATPMHIVTKDHRWILALQRKGFDPGMLPVFKPGSLLRHEGFYSLFMQTWSEIDSIPSALVPRYLPHGLE